MMEGSIKFGLWHVYIQWDKENVVRRIQFVKKEISGQVPIPLSRYLTGKCTDLSPLVSIHTHEDGTYREIYREVQKIPYGETRTYKDIAIKSGTCPRTVGLAMKRNLTPILIPCHRVVSSDGLGGFTPDISIKIDLLQLESKGRKKMENIQVDPKS